MVCVCLVKNWVRQSLPGALYGVASSKTSSTSPHRARTMDKGTNPEIIQDDHKARSWDPGSRKTERSKYLRIAD